MHFKNRVLNSIKGNFRKVLYLKKPIRRRITRKLYWSCL